MDVVLLDGTLNSDLNWPAARQSAERYIEKGSKILWEINLGLSSALSFPFENQMQYNSLKIAVEHFRDTLWKDFQEQSLGLCLYRGSADFSRTFLWNETQLNSLRLWLKDSFIEPDNFRKETGIHIEDFERLSRFQLEEHPLGRHLLRLFCRNVVMDYLDLLISQCPDSLPPYLILDASTIKVPWECAQLLTKERFERWHCQFEGSILPFDQISNTEIKTAVCLPSMNRINPTQWKPLEKAFISLEENKVPFRVIPEVFLISEWDGLDDLIVVSEAVSVQGIRKLQGFCAAGGRVIVLGSSLGLSCESSFQQL